MRDYRSTDLEGVARLARDDAYDDRPSRADLGEPRPICRACHRSRHDECWGCGCECNADDEGEAA